MLTVVLAPALTLNLTFKCYLNPRANSDSNLNPNLDPKHKPSHIALRLSFQNVNHNPSLSP